MRFFRTASTRAHMAAVHSRPCRFLLFLFLFLLLVCSVVSTADDAPPKPDWGHDCTAPYDRCVTVKVHPDWANPARRADDDKDNNKRLFYTLRLEGKFRNPESTLTAWYVGDYMGSEVLTSLFETAFVNVVVVHPRGGRDATPSIVCGGSTSLDATRCWPTPACAANLKSNLDARTNHFNNYTLLEKDVVDMGLFSLDQHAADLEFVIAQLTPANRQNIIIAEGLRGAVVMRYLARTPEPANMAVVFINPPPSPEHYHFLGGSGSSTTSPSSPSLSFYGPALDAVLQRLLALCDQDATCSYRLGATEGAWSRYLNVKHSLEEGLLPCVQQLEWGSSAPASGSAQPGYHSSVFKNSFSNRWRSGNGAVVAEALQYMLFYMFYQHGIAAPTDTQLLSIIPSMLYRLQRCNAEDVKALNSLYTYLYPFINSEGVAKGTADKNSKGGCTEADVMHKYVWLMNDFRTNTKANGPDTSIGDDTNVNVPINFDSTKFNKISASKYRSLFEEQEGLSLYPPQEALSTLQSMASSFPTYTNAKSVRNDIKLIASTKTKMLIFLSDLDIFFPMSGVSQLLTTYGTSGSTQVRYMRGSAHHPLGSNTITQCISLNVRAYRETFQFAAADACLASKEKTASLSSPGAVCGAVAETTDTATPESLPRTPLLGEDPHRQHVLQFINMEGATYFGVNDVWAFTTPNPREPPEGRDGSGGSFLGKVWRGFLKLMLWLFYALCAIAVAYGIFFLFLRIQYICCNGSSSGNDDILQAGGGSGIVGAGYTDNWSADTSRYNLEGLPPVLDANNNNINYSSSGGGFGDRVRALFGRNKRSYSQSGATDTDFFTLVRQQNV